MAVRKPKRDHDGITAKFLVSSEFQNKNQAICLGPEVKQQQVKQEFIYKKLFFKYQKNDLTFKLPLVLQLDDVAYVLRKE